MGTPYVVSCCDTFRWILDQPEGEARIDGEISAALLIWRRRIVLLLLLFPIIKISVIGSYGLHAAICEAISPFPFSVRSLKRSNFPKH